MRFRDAQQEPLVCVIAHPLVVVQVDALKSVRELVIMKDPSLLAVSI